MFEESYNYILNGRVFMAVTTLFQSVFGMWYITGLFFMFKFLVYLRTKNVSLGFAVSIIFLGVVSGGGVLFDSGLDFINSSAFKTVVALAVLEFAGVLYSVIWKK